MPLNQVILAEERRDWARNAQFYALDRHSPLQKFFEEKTFSNYQLTTSKWRVLELGAGSGQFARFFEKPVLVDLSPEMLALAQENQDCEIVEASAHKLPFAADSFDLVVVNNSLHHFKAAGILEESLEEVYRVLKPDGVFCVTDRAPNLAGNGSVYLLSALKKLLGRLVGASAGCASYNEPPFLLKDYAAIERIFVIEHQCYWRTLPTYALTVLSHHLGLNLNWEAAWRLQNSSLGLIKWLERKATWPFWCTELSLRAKKRAK